MLTPHETLENKKDEAKQCTNTTTNSDHDKTMQHMEKCTYAGKARENHIRRVRENVTHATQNAGILHSLNSAIHCRSNYAVRTFVYLHLSGRIRLVICTLQSRRKITVRQNYERVYTQTHTSEGTNRGKTENPTNFTYIPP